MNQQDFKKWIKQVNERIQEQKEYLSELDGAIGDGDHGVNMARGFQEVVNRIETFENPDIGALLQQVAMTLIGKVGGASGPLYGTAFLKAAGVLKGVTECTQSDLILALEEGLKGIKMRGKAEVGDKTMIDVWEPLLSKWKENPETSLKELKAFTAECMEGTRHLEAKKGRAAYLGKRSIGTLDPGSVSSYILFDTLFSNLEDVAS